MTVKNNPALGYVPCGPCSGRASVHQTTRGAGRFLYTRCTACGVDQRTGAHVQSAWWYACEWLPGLKPEHGPANLLAEPEKAVVMPEIAGSEPDPSPVVEPAREPEPAPVDPVGDTEPEGWGGLAWLGGGLVILLAAIRG